METVNSIASAASKAIWGEPSQSADTEEPRSGETGDVSAGEPYDKGNEEPSSTASEPTNPTTSSSTKTDMPDNAPTTIPIPSAHETDKTGVTLAHNPIPETPSDAPTSSNDIPGAGPTPSVGADPSSGVKADGGDFDAANPGAGKEADRLLETKAIHQDTPASTDSSKAEEAEEDEDTGESPSGGKAKLKGLKDKIKAKLHKN